VCAIEESDERGRAEADDPTRPWRPRRSALNWSIDDGIGGEGTQTAAGARLSVEGSTVEAVRLCSLAEEDYAWVMHWAKRGEPHTRHEIERLRDLRTQLQDHCDEQGDERTAIREAARAVAAHAVGFRVEHILLWEDRSGQALWSDPCAFDAGVEQSLESLFALATVQAAGYVAEELAWGQARAPERHLIADITMKLRDLNACEQPIRERVRTTLSLPVELPISHVAAMLVERQEALARSMLQANWETVVTLARKARSRRFMSQRELSATLADVPLVDDCRYASSPCAAATVPGMSIMPVGS
jgi:hypothetical protein